jgi:hypothetical protein
MKKNGRQSFVTFMLWVFLWLTALFAASYVRLTYDRWVAREAAKEAVKELRK